MSHSVPVRRAGVPGTKDCRRDTCPAPARPRVVSPGADRLNACADATTHASITVTCIFMVDAASAAG